MERQARGARSLLQRLQAERRKRETEFWERVETLIGMEEHSAAGRLPNPMGRQGPSGAEEAEIQENCGEFSDRFTDQGERRQTPAQRS